MGRPAAWTQMKPRDAEARPACVRGRLGSLRSRKLGQVDVLMLRSTTRGWAGELVSGSRIHCGRSSRRVGTTRAYEAARAVSASADTRAVHRPIRTETRRSSLRRRRARLARPGCSTPGRGHARPGSGRVRTGGHERANGAGTRRFPRRKRVGARGFEPPTARPPAGCATRLRHAPRSLHLTAAAA